MSELVSHRRQLTPSTKSLGSGVVFDPCPTNLRNVDIQKRLERLRCDLIATNWPCAWLNILIPSVVTVAHDHTYCKVGNEVVAANKNTNNCNHTVFNLSYNNSCGDVTFIELEVKATTAEEVLKSLSLTPEERLQLEKDTRSQSECTRWYEAHRVRITGSKCGRVITLKKEIRNL